LTEVEKAYFAGIFDGEGTIGYYQRKRGYYQIQLAITNTDFGLLTWIQSVVPYGFTRVRESRRDHPSRLPQWEWTLTAKAEAHEVLTELRPYLRVKGRQADVLLSLLDGESMTRQRTSPAIDLRRQTAVIELKRLKRDSNRHVSVH
jgi:hypothetical protein